MRPGVSGSIVDGHGSTPIVNASIVVHTHYSAKQIVDTRIVANPDGTFALAPKQKWGIYIVPADVFFPWSDATVEAPGYETMEFRLNRSPMDSASKVALGEVRLNRVQ